MTINSLYIYDRHCICVYYQDWHRTRRPKVAAEGGIYPGVSRSMHPSAPQLGADAASSTAYTNPRNTLQSTSGVVVAINNELSSPRTQAQTVGTNETSTGLPFDEEAKLVYGVILSLKNMVKKLSGRDEQFTCYRTSSYKLHVFETMSGYRFVMLSDAGAESLRFVLRQIYAGPFIEHVVSNPLIRMDSRERGVDNEAFRMAVDRMVRNMPSFA
ncbi:snare-like protein [Fistulina hepatica ATCC 64428]|uniref:Trafficking protein particle complex subunit n=1 Tax=Fistulina hepatica ATCC 64428 TaxID=1128425 RepID=A0A0D7A8N9_9AGAR|nr:snare-like protein [Fistulina hepatica ATCC 64428]